jgi:uncharacterized protein (UPF0332 family)
MFYAATAALLSLEVKRSKHSGVIAAFGQRFVKTGKFTAEHQRALQDAFTDRSAGDYAGVFPTREEVERRLVEADNFVQSVADFLNDQGAQV